jgi:hypothetical protein
MNSEYIDMEEIIKLGIPPNNEEELKEINDIKKMLSSLLKEMFENRNNFDYDSNKTKELYQMLIERLDDINASREKYNSDYKDLMKNIERHSIRNPGFKGFKGFTTSVDGVGFVHNTSTNVPDTSNVPDISKFNVAGEC